MFMYFNVYLYYISPSNSVDAVHYCYSLRALIIYIVVNPVYSTLSRPTFKSFPIFFSFKFFLYYSVRPLDVACQLDFFITH